MKRVRCVIEEIPQNRRLLALHLPDGERWLVGEAPHRKLRRWTVFEPDGDVPIIPVPVLLAALPERTERRLSGI